jgi:hypothetical protein
MNGERMSDEDTVSMVVNNYEGPYRELQDILNRVCWWDDDDSTWNDIDKAADRYRELVTALNPDADGFSDLKGIDLSRVDFREMIREELEQVNLDNGREPGSGLPTFR